MEVLTCNPDIIPALLQDAMTAALSLPGCGASYVHLWIVTTLERLLVLLSLVLNAYVCILFVKTWKFPEKQKQPDEERILTIEKFLSDHSKTLKSTDVEKDANDETCWLVPKPGTDNNTQEETASSKENLRPILDNECAICMNQYTTGDTITFSSNPACIHCFHSDCLRAWLLPSEPQNQLCPCCRQTYCLEKKVP